MNPATYSTYGRTVNDKQRLFHAAKRWRGFNKHIKFAGGGLGGGKSACCLYEIVDTAMMTPGGVSVVVRQSMPKAQESLIRDLGEFLDGMGEWRERSQGYFLPNQHLIACKPADKWDRYGSTKFVSAYVQEAQEVKKRIVDTLSERLRDPAGMVGDQPMYRLLIDSRPVPTRHWINEMAESAWNVETGYEGRLASKTPYIAYVKFSSYDNKQNLRPRYIEELLEEHRDDPAWVRMMIYGDMGYDVEGKPAFSDSYRPELHDADIEADPAMPILRGWDFGYHHPAVVFCQFIRGRLLVLRELCPSEIARDRLVDMVIDFQAEQFPDHHPSSYRDFGDIAGDQTNAATGITDIEYVQGRLETVLEGLRKDNVENGLDEIRRLMRKLAPLRRDLRPRFLVDRRCTVLREALRGLYYYEQLPAGGRRIKKGQGYDDPVDALRYVTQTVVAEGMDDGGETAPAEGWVRSFASY